jgi:hypothetical protein
MFILGWNRFVALFLICDAFLHIFYPDFFYLHSHRQGVATPCFVESMQDSRKSRK